MDARLEAKATDAQAKDVPLLHKALNAVRLAYRTLRPASQVATDPNANQARPLALQEADRDSKRKSCTETGAACRAATQGLTSMQYCSDQGPLYCPLSQVSISNTACGVRISRHNRMGTIAIFVCAHNNR